MPAPATNIDVAVIGAGIIGVCTDDGTGRARLACGDI